jgi:hypothetical protein
LATILFSHLKSGQKKSGFPIAIKKSDHFSSLNQFMAMSTNHLKTQPFDYRNQKLSGSSNGSDFWLRYSDDVCITQAIKWEQNFGPF